MSFYDLKVTVQVYQYYSVLTYVGGGKKYGMYWQYYYIRKYAVIRFNSGVEIFQGFPGKPTRMSDAQRPFHTYHEAVFA